MSTSKYSNVIKHRYVFVIYPIHRQLVAYDPMFTMLIWSRSTNLWKQKKTVCFDLFKYTGSFIKHPKETRVRVSTKYLAVYLVDHRSHMLTTKNIQQLNYRMEMTRTIYNWPCFVPVVVKRKRKSQHVGCSTLSCFVLHSCRYAAR